MQHNHSGDHQHNRGLVLIGAFKVLKAVLEFAAAFGVLKLMHHDLYDVGVNVLHYVHLDPDRELISKLLDKFALISDQRLRQISIVTFILATVEAVEGIGLVLKKPWAEYLTAIVTASFLPWELFAILRHVTLWKVGLTIANALVLLYLLYHLRKNGRIFTQNAVHTSPDRR